MITIKGKHSVIEALQSPIHVQEVVFFEKIHSKEDHFIETLCRQKNVSIKFLDKQSAQKKYQLENHQRIIANIENLPLKPLSLLSIENHPLIVILDHLEDPFNAGAIMRTCEGLGVKTIIIAKNRQAPINSGVIKASSGAAYHLNIIQVSNIAQAILHCQKIGYWVYATDSEKGKDLNSFSPSKGSALVLGNENKGISQRVSKLVDHHIKIEMKGNIQSFNVSVAAGILLYDFVKKIC
jgi:23S rRNA (guanosine2251-2'-O)-methyltransferase